MSREILENMGMSKGCKGSYEDVQEDISKYVEVYVEV